MTQYPLAWPAKYLLKMSFTSPKYLQNPHLQTILPALLPLPKKKYLKEELCFDDGDFTEIVWSDDPTAKEYKDVCVLFHGLGGGINSHYIQGMISTLRSKGYLCVLMHFRGCGSKTNNTIRCYHAGETEDARFFINTLKQRFAKARIHAIGYSLGANMLLKLLASYKELSPLHRAVAISAPLELETCAHHLNKGFAQIYQKHLLKSLKVDLLIKASHFDLENSLGLSKKRIKSIKSIYEFDDIYTAPVHGFKDAIDYYTKNSSKQFLKEIQTPTLMIHSLDDPFMPSSILPTKEQLSPCITLEISKNGGHVGFIQGSIFKPDFWLEKRVSEFL